MASMEKGFNILDPFGIGKAANTPTADRTGLQKLVVGTKEPTGTSMPTPSSPKAGARAAFDWNPYRVGGATREDSFTGMNPEFSGSLQTMVEAMPPEIREKFMVTSGYRSPEKQAELYAAKLKENNGDHAKTRRMVAPAGKSQHNHGSAADLKYADDDVKDWVHANAKAYGMHFPMSWEPWHIEPIGARAMRGDSTSQPIEPEKKSDLHGIANDLSTTAREARMFAMESRKPGDPIGTYDPVGVNPGFTSRLGGGGPQQAGVPSNVGAPPGPKGPIMPDGKPVPNPAAPAPAAAEPGPAGATAPPAGPGGLRGLSDKLSNALFPNQENPREKMGQMLSSLGVGLGQMAQGQGVDLQPYFNNIADNKAAGAAAAAKAEETRFSQQMQIEQLRISDRNATIGERSANLAETRAIMENMPGGGVFTPEQLDIFEADAGFQDFIPMLRAGGEGGAAIRQKGIEGIMDVLEERREKISETPQLGNMLTSAREAQATGDYTNLTSALDNYDGDATTLGHILKTAGLQPTTAMANSEFAAKMKKENPEVYEELLRQQNASGGISESAAVRNDREFSEKALTTMTKTVTDNLQTARTLSKMKALATAELNGDKKSLAGFNKSVGSWLSSAKQLMPGAAEQFEKSTGFSIDHITEQNKADATLGLVVAQQMLKGQGTVTDGERQRIMDSIVQGDMTPETRLEAIATLETLAAIDKAMAAKFTQFHENVGADGVGWGGGRVKHSKLTREGAAMAEEFGRVAGKISAHNNRKKGSYADDYIVPETRAEQEALLAELAPIMTQAQYDEWGHLVPKTAHSTGARTYWQLDDGKGPPKFMNGSNPYNFE